MRHTGWRRLRGDSDRPDLLELGKKLLGYLDNQRRLSGVPSLTIQRETPDGSIVRARWIGDQPLIEIRTVASPPREESVARYGFVTWPTDATTGAPYEANSDRIILAAPDYSPIREPGYAGVFPAGLNRAGNIDWHGAGPRPWVVSWYGPRTRYIDFSAPLEPWVFFKGQVLVDARDFIDVDAVVLGACVAQFGGDAWLVVVNEDFYFARWERVWTVRLVGEPTDPEVTVDAGSFIMLDGRTHGDYNYGSHPWVFNPRGTEGRMLTEASDAQGDGLYERIIRLVEDGESDNGFAVERDQVVHPLQAKTTHEGYTSATYGRYVGAVQHISRSVPDPATFLPTDSTGLPSGTWVDTPGFFSEGVHPDEAYPASSIGMIGFTYERRIANPEAWQLIAVDYLPDGEVVYAHGRTAELLRQEAGTMAPEAGSSVPRLTAAFNTHAINFRSRADGAGGFDVHLADYDSGHTIDATTHTIAVERTMTEEATIAGIRVGGIEVLGTRSRTLTEAGSYTLTRPGDSSGAAPQEENSVTPGVAFVPINPEHKGTVNNAFDTMTGEASYLSVEDDTSLFLVHMDLRHGALFVAKRLQHTVDAIDKVADYNMAGFDGTFTRTTAPVETVTWDVVGWIDGEPVLVDVLVAVDDAGGGTTILPQPGNDVEYPWAWTPDLVDARFNNNLVEDTAELFIPILYGDDTKTAALKASVAYRLVSSGPEVVQQLTQSWSGEFNAADSDLEAVDFPGEIKTRWHPDLDGMNHVGAWAYYRRGWAFSMALPAINLPETPFRNASYCGRGEIGAITKSAADYYWPIWVLAPTKRILSG